MRQPVDELLLALSHGLDGWMLGNATDPIEIASFLSATGNRALRVRRRRFRDCWRTWRRPD